MHDFNKYQTKLTEELIATLPKNIYLDLVEIIDSIPFIFHLLADERVRGFAKNRKKDSDGKIIVDITKPHILEDMDYFRQPALHHEKFGKYTNFYPNKHPNSEYSKFWKEEKRRWKEGLTRESDGEWIPGHYYFYLNYSPIWKVVVDKEEDSDKKGKRKGKRIKGFPNVMLGDYLFYHYVDQAIKQGKHGDILKTRGVGFSYKMGSISPCIMYTQPGLPCFHLASDKTYLLGDKGVFGKVVDTLDWIGEHTPFPRLRGLGDLPLEKVIGYKDEYGTRRGLKSSVFGISIKDNPDKARGIRGPLIHYEENGVMPNFERAWNVNRKAVEDGDIVYGFMIAGGTGGTEGANFEGAEKMFYTPAAYNIYGIENVFDKNADGSTECGFFWGAYLNRAYCYDLKTGEPDVIKALIEILLGRHEEGKTSRDPIVMTQKKAEEPITPQDAVMRVEGTLFPVADLKDHLSTIMPNYRSFVSEHYIGKISIDPHGVTTWTIDPTEAPIHDFPMKDNKNKQGAIEIFQPPVKLNNGNIPHGRYIAGADPYDDDSSTTTSLGSILVLDTFTDEIVCEYTGRPSTAVEFYDIVYKILKHYNATCLYESFNKGLFAYMDRKNALYLLADNPNILKQMDYIKGDMYGNKKKGFPPSKPVNNWARRLAADWLISAPQVINEDLPDQTNLHKIRSIGLIRELIGWNSDGNFDRVSALQALMIYREERAKYVISVEEDVNKEDYFFKNYKPAREKFLRDKFQSKL